MGVPAHICAVGLYSGGNRRRLCLPLTFQNQAPLRGSCPQGVTIPNADAMTIKLYMKMNFKIHTFFLKYIRLYRSIC